MLTLRATDLGLGSCWIMMFDREKVKKLLGLDEKYDIVALLPIGYPDQAPVQRPRLNIKEVLLKEI
jgi:nitroreductase